MKKASIFLLLLISCSTALFSQTSEKMQEMPGWKSHFDAYQLEGSFLLYNEKEESWLVYNQQRSTTAFLPASTFKILNSLIAFETGVIESPKTLLSWDGKKRWNDNWNKDLPIKEAFAVSCVPCYQEIARRIGLQRMQEWVSKAQYGSMDIQEANLDIFWLSGNSRISQLEQIQFLRRLQNGSLPFKQESLQKLKSIMLRSDTGTVRVYAKTGLTEQEGQHIGWYVGFVQAADNTYYFALNLQKEATVKNDHIFGARIAIADQILKELGLL